MGNFKGWTADQVKAVEARQTSARIDRKEKAMKAKAHKKSCMCEDCSAKHIANMPDKEFEANINRLKKAKAYNSPIIDELVDSLDTASLKKTERRMIKQLKQHTRRSGQIETTFIGVDPALRKGGFWVCIICRIEHTATFKTCRHLGEFVQLLIDANPAAVIVENSNLQKNVFARNAHAGIGGALSVGKNMGVSQAAADIAQGFSCIPSGISPQQKGAKVVSEALFQSAVNAHGLTLVGYKKGTGIGQDQRDAFKLACIAEQQYRLYKKSLKQN